MKQYILGSSDEVVAAIVDSLAVLERQPITEITLSRAQAIINSLLSSLVEERVIAYQPEVTVEWRGQALSINFPKDWEDIFLENGVLG